MMNFCLWFLQQLPAFLLSEPICYLIGFAFLIVIIGVIRDIVYIRR